MIADYDEAQIVCRVCLTSKPRSSFSLHSKETGRLRGECKACRVLYAANRRAAGLIARTDEHKRRSLKKKTDPALFAKYRARRAVAHALRMGRIRRGPCASCGGAAEDGHHEDYSKRLEVTWLCKPCHRQLHKERGDAR